MTSQHQRPTNHHAKRSKPTKRTHQPVTQAQIPPQAYVQAYEVQLIYGRDDLAQSLGEPSSGSGSGGGRGLIRWAGEREVDQEVGKGGGDIWLDRHDILHLLPTLPPNSTNRTKPPSSPASTSSSWDSLPSDAEDIFFLSGSEEEEEYEAGKRRRWLEGMREERVREREREERERGDVSGKAGGWEGDDEEPPPPILILMQHTAKSLSTSPNPSILEIRILANHARDERFSFLKGRYKATWERLKREARPAAKGHQVGEAVIGGLMGGYGSSDEDGDEYEGEGGREPEGSPPAPPPSPPPVLPADNIGESQFLPERKTERPITVPDDGREQDPVDAPDEEEKRRQRRIRAEEWKRKRAEEKK